MEPEQKAAEEINDIVSDPLSEIGHNIADTLGEIRSVVEKKITTALDEKLQDAGMTADRTRPSSKERR